MKIRLFLLVILACSAFACEKEEKKDGTEEKTTIDGQEFNPTQASIINYGESLVLTFEEGNKAIEITTNDTVAGTYEITTQALKSTALMANLVYTDGTITYTANSGSVTITDEGDGVMSGSYNATVVSEEVELEISSGAFSEIGVEASTEEETPVPVTEESINDTLLLCYTNLENFVQFEFLFDAVYSNKISSPNTSWDAIYSHSQNSTNEMVAQMWTKAWEVILPANFVLENAENIIADEESKNAVIAQAKAIRSYTYYTLSTWFGSLPLVQVYEPASWAMSQIGDVLDMVKNDALAAAEYLPVTWGESDGNKVTKTLVQGILCRVYLYDQDYTGAMNLAQTIVNSGNFALDVTVDNITSESNETYWGFAKGDDEVFNASFTKGSYVPVIRYTETILVSAEAAYNLGQQMEAANYINMLKNRREESEVMQVATDIIYEQYITELEQEGNVFNTIKRFSKATSSLQIEDFRQVLPIPQSAIDSNPDLYQNPGY